MVSQDRANRIAQRIQEELAELFLYDISDPRLQGAYVTQVRVDRELAYANIFVSSLDGSEAQEEILAALAHAAGFLRSQLAKRLDLRFMPRVRFYWDPAPEHADRIDQLIDSWKQEGEEGGDQED